jgi:hypothetical protein
MFSKELAACGGIKPGLAIIKRSEPFMYFSSDHGGDLDFL